MSVNQILSTLERGADCNSEAIPPSRFVDKQWLRQRLAEMDKDTAFVLDSSATAQQARELMLADGVRPQDNISSREIMRLRYEEDEAL